MKVIHFYKSNGTAIMHPMKGYIQLREYDDTGEYIVGTEHLFRELSNAIKYLLDKEYFIEYLFNTVKRIV